MCVYFKPSVNEVTQYVLFCISLIFANIVRLIHTVAYIIFIAIYDYKHHLQVALVVKNPPNNAGDTGNGDSISGSGRCPGGRNGNPLQYSCLENSMDRGASQVIVLVIVGLQRVEHD